MSAKSQRKAGIVATVLGLALLALSVFAGGAAAMPHHERTATSASIQDRPAAVLRHEIACFDPGGCLHHSDMTCCAVAAGIGLVPALTPLAAHFVRQAVSVLPADPARDRFVRPLPKPPNARS